MKPIEYPRFNAYTLLRDLVKNLWVIILAAVVGFGGCLTYVTYIHKKQYSSSMTIAINVGGYSSHASAQLVARTIVIAQTLDDVFKSEALVDLVKKDLEKDDVYLTPNMTYKPRVIKKPKHCVVNGSVAILIPKDGQIPTDKQMEFFSTDEYRLFYQIARNYQTRSLNVDSCSVFFYGLLRDIDKLTPITEDFTCPNGEGQISIFDSMKRG